MMRTISAAPDLGLAGHAVAVGERALMRAVLEDAIQCLAGEVGPERERAQLAAAAYLRDGIDHSAIDKA